GSSSAIVAGLTAAALATVGWLGYQASENVPADLRQARAGTAPAAPEAPRSGSGPTALPARSGEVRRVTSPLLADRVWLVGEGGRVTRTYTVSASTVDPAPGTCRVTSRSTRITGSDGIPVEHVVRFAAVEGTVLGFSSAVDAATP